MSASTRLALPYIDAAQSQKHVTHNEALLALDALVMLSVRARGAAAPPAAPAEGDRFILGDAPTGAFAGRARALAAFDDGGWSFLAPRAGWRAYVEDEDVFLLYDGTVWKDVGLSLREVKNLSRLGVGVAADAANPLSAKLNSALFAARPAAEGGTGDLRFVLNKSAAGATVSQIYQSNWSGRAETGLAGDDHFRLKVSPDGAAWTSAIDVDPATGLVALPQTAGKPNGLATLDATGKVPPAQLPTAGPAVGPGFRLITRDPVARHGWSTTVGGTAAQAIPAAAFSYLVVGVATAVASAAVYVQSGVAGANVRLALYRLAADNGPGALIADFGAVAAATPGIKTFTRATPLQLDAGVYFVVVQSSDPTVTFRGATQNTPADYFMSSGYDSSVLNGAATRGRIVFLAYAAPFPPDMTAFSVGVGANQIQYQPTWFVPNVNFYP